MTTTKRYVFLLLSNRNKKKYNIPDLMTIDESIAVTEMVNNMRKKTRCIFTGVERIDLQNPKIKELSEERLDTFLSRF